MSEIIGRTITEIRDATEAENAYYGWIPNAHRPSFCVVLDDGTRLFPSKDQEGNGPGTMFGRTPTGADFQLA